MGRLAPALLGATLLVTTAAGCRDGRVPWPQLPQLEEAGQLREYGGERARAARACQSASDTLRAYVACMEAAGWTFIPRGSFYPADECWSLRDADDPRRLPAAHCFHRSGSAPGVPETEEPAPPLAPEG